MENMSEAPPKNRCWVFTHFDVSEENRIRLTETECKYMVFGLETCPTTSRQHFQGYVEFANQRSFKSVQSALGCHIEPRKGTAQQAIRYCKKEKNFFEMGVEPSGQGARNDIKDVSRMVEEGKSFTEIIDSSSSFQSLKIAQTILPFKEPQRFWKPYVSWYYGVSGAGKTHTAEMLNHPGERVHVQTGTDQWWQGYDAHPVVVIDDFRPAFCKFERLLQLLDRYPCTVAYKGGSRQFVPKYIYITTHQSVKDTYPYDSPAVLEQLIRRIDDERYFGEKYLGTIENAIPPPNHHQPEDAVLEEGPVSHEEVRSEGPSTDAA